MTVRLAVWSGPRNLSTALMRSWENRPDTNVLDEPLYAHYLASTGLEHPMADEVIAAGFTTEAEAIAACLAPLPDDAGICYQKHMSHHLLPDMDLVWLSQLDQNVLLIRDPARVLASYGRKRDDVAPQSLTLDDIGLRQQLLLYRRSPGGLPVIDSHDLLSDPATHLAWLCDLVGVAFDSNMLSWPAGLRQSDGVWASHWYDSVAESTGFAAQDTTPRPEVAPALQPLLAQAEEIYDELFSARLTI